MKSPFSLSIDRSALNYNYGQLLTAMAAMIAFFITNFTKIHEILYSDPKIRVSTEDEFLLRHGILKIGDIVHKTLAIEMKLRDSKEWVTLSPGSYEAKIILNNQPYFTENIYLEKGDADIISVPPRENGSIEVFIERARSKYPPGAEFEAEVESSGNGYLWVFDWRKDHYQIIYPTEDQSITAIHKAITFGVPFIFPRPEGELTIKVAEDAGEERLLFVVTSSDNFDFAQVIANRFNLNILSKASLGQREENWGVAEITYHVENLFY